MARVSHSQYSMYSSCQYKYKLNYIDKHKKPAGIYAQFGSAMHNTMQHYLDVYYKISKRQADKINVEKLLQQHLMDAVKKESEKLPDGEFVCSREEIEEFYWQGIEILRWFTKDANLRKLFQKKGYELVGIEIPVNVSIRENVSAIGFIDIVLRDSNTGNIIIIDLKTSTAGWSKWQKGDDVKKNQIILYKMWYSMVFNIPVDKISVEFHVMRRIMPKDEDMEWTVPRISKFAPPSGKIKQRQAMEDFMYFVNDVFDVDGNYKVKEYKKNPGKQCSWCEFNGTLCDPNE